MLRMSHRVSSVACDGSVAPRMSSNCFQETCPRARSLVMKAKRLTAPPATFLLLSQAPPPLQSYERQPGWDQTPRHTTQLPDGSQLAEFSDAFLLCIGLALLAEGMAPCSHRVSWVLAKNPDVGAPLWNEAIDYEEGIVLGAHLPDIERLCLGATGWNC